MYSKAVLKDKQTLYPKGIDKWWLKKRNLIRNSFCFNDYSFFHWNICRMLFSWQILFGKSWKINEKDISICHKRSCQTLFSNMKSERNYYLWYICSKYLNPIRGQN